MAELWVVLRVSAIPTLRVTDRLMTHLLYKTNACISSDGKFVPGPIRQSCSHSDL